MNLLGHLAGKRTKVDGVASTRGMDHEFLLSLMGDEVVSKLLRVRVDARTRSLLNGNLCTAAEETTY